MQLTEQQKIASARQFFVSYLHQFTENGSELLTALDDIVSGEVAWFDPSTL